MKGRSGPHRKLAVSPAAERVILRLISFDRNRRCERLGCSMPARLLSLSDEPSIVIDKPILLIGRHPECDIQIDSRKISRRHCCIAQVADYLVVRDLASTNGIRINGVRVLEGRLKENDELMIGALRYRVSWDVPSEPLPYPGRELGDEAERAGVLPPVAADEDAVLEASDEPVALVDNRDIRPGLAADAASGAAGREAGAAENGAAESPLRPPSERPSALFHPEALNLAPPSGTE
jgi:predicted component of type VI protein secretion system